MINYKTNLHLKLPGAFMILEISLLLISKKFNCYSDFLIGSSRCPDVKLTAALLWIPGILAAIFCILFFLKELFGKRFLDILDVVISIVAFLFIMATMNGWTF